MASDFTCSTTSAREQGSVRIEQSLCAEVSIGLGEATPRSVEVIRATFPPEKLNLIDINAKRRYLFAKYHDDKTKILAELRGIFGNINGGTATEALAMPDFGDVAIVAGGIYFATSDKNWPQTGEKTKQGDGFVWYKPDPRKQGYVLSDQQGNFTSGGYLRLDFSGKASMLRLSRGRLQKEPECSFDDYRLIVQSNIILVANGQEDGNPDESKNAVAALSAQQDGRLSLVVATESGKSSLGSGLTYKEFGQLLAHWGSKYAINLDGGPSAQFAVRKEGCRNTQKPESCVENLVHHSDKTNRMPQLFSVSK